MTIFIHGTLKPVEFSFKDLVKVMRNKIDNTIYCATAKRIRKDPFFYSGQAIQGVGLKKIDAQSPSNGARCLADLYETQHTFLGNEHQRSYYTFGWDGLLNRRKRYEAAEYLYKELADEVKKLQEQDLEPRITIIAYSHGANVALNLVAVKHDNPKLDQNAFTVNQLVMLGAPIQKETDYLVTDPLFERIFNVYSSEDSIQALDIFSGKQFFSGKKFVKRGRFNVPSKITQVRLRTIKSLRGLHKVTEEPAHPYELLGHKGIRFIHRDPGHTELWNFKWGDYWYRDIFPLNPLPAVTFVPSILHALTQYTPDKRSVTFDYAHSYAGALLIPRIKHDRQAVPILDEATNSKLHTIADTYTPRDFSPNEQYKRASEILEEVQTEMRKSHGLKASKRLVNCFHKERHHSFPKGQEIGHTHLLRS